MIPDEIGLENSPIFRQEIRTAIRFFSPAAARSLLLYGWFYGLGMHEMQGNMNGW
jgi:hypothetical protein